MTLCGTEVLRSLSQVLYRKRLMVLHPHARHQRSLCRTTTVQDTLSPTCAGLFNYSMSQHMSQAEVQLQGSHVTQFIHTMQQRDDAMLQNFSSSRETLLDAAELYANEKDQQKLEDLRKQLLKVVETEQQIKQHRAALTQVQANYQPSLDKTDFGALIQQHMQQTAAQTQFHPERDESVKEFDQLAGTSGGAEQELDEDEDLVMVGNVEKNDRCPYTRKDVADLDDPVEDQLGFVYEGAAIRDALKLAARDHMNWIECPLPAVSHRIMLYHLKPANKRRLQRLARARQQQQQTQAGGGRVVLEV